MRLAITADSQLIGVIGLESADGGTTAEIGYWLAQPAWGKGYATEAARAIVDHAFTGIGCTSMIARYAIGNEASRRILLGLGFEEQGESTGACRATGGETTVMELTLSRSGWAQAKGSRQ
jgi:RimJ/RimL family protein N-acetyltransferase